MAKEEMAGKFDCDDQGPMKEYVGCKVERDEHEGWIKLTQPVILQSFNDEFDLPGHINPMYPAPGGDHLNKGTPEEA